MISIENRIVPQLFIGIDYTLIINFEHEDVVDQIMEVMCDSLKESDRIRIIRADNFEIVSDFCLATQQVIEFISTLLKIEC